MAETSILHLRSRGLYGIIGRTEGYYVAFNYLPVFHAKTHQNENVASDGMKKWMKTANRRFQQWNLGVWVQGLCQDVASGYMQSELTHPTFWGDLNCTPWVCSQEQLSWHMEVKMTNNSLKAPELWVGRRKFIFQFRFSFFSMLFLFVSFQRMF